ncbi:efflux transporter outer membrane subunit [Geothermobacter hydrogeniphilus]|uniref:Efflux transporter, outer membrane factor (OMF) lipoprotein, NodT family n=1 Tax=Geothermobacter hydrogeniphilus TaxID=1969733 RepID=A0A1X0Y0C8_9BACT|nr:efflux transporter outer membrane subunit [Geothermobacter hydrogeniphilus]ORJ58544.1 hypothetical protein B5V00_11890 [Geothermobacter hydrogeniphilus]
MRIFLPLFAGVLLLSGCSLYQPTAVSPPPDLPRTYLAATPETEAGRPPDRWWLAFGDEDLNRLMTRLFEQNLQLEEGFARVEQARAALTVAGSTLWPSLGLGGQGSHELVPGFIQDARVFNYRFSVQSGYELDLWGKLRSRKQAAAELLQSGENQLRSLYISLSAQLADLYFLAVEQRAQLALTDQTIVSYRETLQRVEDRYQRGLVPAVDVYQARQTLAAAESSRPRFAKALATAEHGIATLLGSYPAGGAAGTLDQLPSFADQFPTGLPASLLQRRPDVAARFHQLRSADDEVAAAIADRLPTLNLAANYGYLQTDFGIGAITGNFWQLIAQPAVTLLDGGRRRAEVERNRAVVRERLAGYRQAVLDAYREVEDSLVANQTDEQRLATLQRTVDATSASLRLALQNYLYGLTDYLPVLTAQRNDFQARSELLAARRQLISDRISLARALGGTWMEKEISQRFAGHKESASHE